ncbi:Clan ME, family M16, insulinase-like metallopeptidase [Tritrichomonas foetus]|uniref:Clan ME, family M16, insulinase-like metallopeptidase n=1 Tax=Tritrichomonas foetus TaxID=1144522 RepID=A0A1J4K124_9EUKA|nr:Clan ME, family M16, insulinase-like metallopeptidase [Tritrichomonas foetus]|eukprot:OHT03454.1 Clan ME, family M16, insulinase-like metallopeptidase [Tritrichomonas foetus]
MSEIPQEVSGFEFVSKYELPDLGTTSLVYKHKKHGCQFVYLKTEDSHNFFAATFRTAPYDDSGRSHMLEHLVLNGTEKYPVNDLFSELDKRSFSTFMNALTSNQFTSFPFSTINKQDYFNILDVYLDSCFHPKLSGIDFMSECFHVEFEDNDPSKPLINGGVVYNEMKGCLTNPARRCYHELVRRLLPDSYEHFESGGLPECIAQSTIDDIREHHKKYYHPSNALFFHYGNIPIEEVFAKVDEVISPFPTVEWKFDKSIFNQPRWAEPKRVEIEGSYDPMTPDKTKQNRIIVSYLTDSWEDPLAIKDIDFLFDLLTYDDNSPMYKAIIKPGYAVKTFLKSYNDSTYNTHTDFGFEGISAEDIDKVINLIQTTLETCYKEGFDKDRVQALIHENELRTRETQKNMGLSFFYQIAYSQCYGVSPHLMLDGNVYINRIHTNLEKNPRYYEDLMKRVFFENTHRLTMIVKPVDGFLDKITNSVTESLAEKKKNLTQEEIDTIVKNYNLLKEEQAKPQPVDCLPSIKRSDMVQKITHFHLSSFEDNVAVYAAPLNQMTYIDMRFSIDFSHPLIDYFPILSLVIDSIGAGDMDEEQLDLFMSLHCKKVNFSIHSVSNDNDPDDVSAQLKVTTACLDRNIDPMMKALRMIILEPHLDNAERIKALIKRHMSLSARSITSRGHDFANKLMTSCISNTAALTSVFNGPKHVEFVKELIKKDDWTDVCEKLKVVYKECFLKSKVTGLVHTTSTDCKAIPILKELVAQLNSHENVHKSLVYNKDAFLASGDKIFIDTETSTNFTVSTCKSVSFNDDLSPIFTIASEILSNEFIHQMVRVKIGAYGAWARNSAHDGYFSFVSYRDPNVPQVLEAFSKSLDQCYEELTDEMVDRAVVKCFASLDSPEDPHRKGTKEFEGYTEEILQKRRDIYFKATKQQILGAISILRKQSWYKGAVSSKSINEPPEGFTVISLSEK